MTPGRMQSPITENQPVVTAVRVHTAAQRSAYAVVDALDVLHHQLGAYRALEQLTSNALTAGQESLAQLQRADFAVLLSVLNESMEKHCAKAREAAVSSAKGSQQQN